MSTTTKKKNSATDAKDWDTARDSVRDNADTLKTMTSHSELFSWAKEHGIDTGSLFRKWKTELRKQLHIDYDDLRQKAFDARLAEMDAAAQAAPQVMLYAAGDVEVNSFAVCSEHGEDPWYGEFNDNDRVDDQDSADLEAARKAIYLAGQARDYKKLDLIGLRLVVSNHRVTTRALQRDTLKHSVFVTVEVVDNGEDNPALEVCRMPGFRTWREVSLTDLLDAAEPTAAQDEGEVA
ncbi:hypothetical protein QBL07_024090 (plasmid) [Gordonia rubripertincta]|uniref:Uncharacterized protein n=2 Tax=Gordonia rubripertincta TaxID=36822 RepID=A0AAW6RGH5_GORRU|nr:MULTISPECIES: hypothetical protein [Gordonia]MDG6783117.1 hypothetical protein [Gordonia rubripertincta]NKY65382.1 hypothetical protein [Gordonia rubripertincta]GAB86870.1 hypothetical protein GORBP_083_00200 [Gordonia rubripertincta NBRC 101908]